jgi:hypothetical protein
MYYFRGLEYRRWRLPIYHFYSSFEVVSKLLKASEATRFLGPALPIKVNFSIRWTVALNLTIRLVTPKWSSETPDRKR